MLDFMTLSGHAKCAGALIAALSLAERMAIVMLGSDHPRSFSNWSEVINHARGTKIRNQSGEPIAAFEYLRTVAQVRPKDRRRVKRNSRSPRAALGELVAKIASHYFREGGPLHEAQERSPEDGAEPAILAFLQGLVERGEEFYDATVASLEAESEDDEIVFHEFVRVCFADLLTVPHVDFPSVPLLSTESIQAEFHGVLSANGRGLRYPSLFAVIREARGWTTEERLQNWVNSIVRDVIWIRDPDRAATVNNASEGLYYSALDDHIYLATIERDRHESKVRPNILINANMSELGKANHFYMFFPSVNQKVPLWVEDGIVAGTATTVEHLAAWKVLLIQPDWDFLQRLETILFILYEDRRFPEVSRLLVSSGVCARLFDQDMVDIPDRAACRNAFRRLLFPYASPGSVERALGGRLRTSLARTFHDTLTASAAGLLDASGGAGDLGGLVQEVVDNLIRNIDEEITSRWHLIEPAQIMTFLTDSERARRRMRRPEIESLIESLLIPLPPVAAPHP